VAIKARLGDDDAVRTLHGDRSLRRHGPRAEVRAGVAAAFRALHQIPMLGCPSWATRRCDPRAVNNQRPSKRARNPPERPEAARSSRHVQRSDTGTPARACSMCWPHPAHVGLAQLGQVTREHMVVILPCFLRWFSDVVF
jgi:hypothetical protein